MFIRADMLEEPLPRMEWNEIPSRSLDDVLQKERESLDPPRQQKEALSV